MTALSIALQGLGSSPLTVALQGFGAPVTKSGVSRQWLIDYYTKQFAPKEPPKTTVKRSKRKTEVLVRQAQKVALKRAEAAALRAQRQVDEIAAQINDAKKIQQFLNEIQLYVIRSNVTIVDFGLIGLNYVHQRRDPDEDLLLFAVGLHREFDKPPIDATDELLLLSHVL